jgi:hypothetical protein
MQRRVAMTRPRWRTIFRIVTVFIAGLLVLAQLVPYGRDHKNPPVAAEPAWDHPSTRALAVRACFDCHSNETQWPWYSNLAPTSWLVQSHVDEGRQTLNFSQWNRRYKEAREASETVRDGSMPPRSYLLIHADSRLQPAERTALARGLDVTLAGVRWTDADD